jgi:anti-sigma regulatory factor (Ser/Thr protein kinase)
VGHGEPSRQLQRRLPAIAASVREIRALAVDFANTRCGADDQLLSDIALCVSEAAANTVAHAYAGRGGAITLTASAIDDAIVIEICDEGRGTPGPSSGLGLGLKIVHALSDASVERPPGAGTRVTMRFPCSSGSDR